MKAIWDPTRDSNTFYNIKLCKRVSSSACSVWVWVGYTVWEVLSETNLRAFTVSTYIAVLPKTESSYFIENLLLFP
jgi:hypothetical protein